MSCSLWNNGRFLLVSPKNTSVRTVAIPVLDFFFVWGFSEGVIPIPQPGLYIKFFCSIFSDMILNDQFTPYGPIQPQ